MATQYYLCFICAAILRVPASSLTITPQDEGCSLVGLDLQNCLAPNTKTPISIDSCCKTLTQVLQAGCYCLRSLLDPSNYPVLTTQLAFFFSSCYISMPSLTHCHVSEPRPFVIAPPLLPSTPLPPVLTPPNLPSNEPFVPLPSKEIGINGNNSPAVEMNPFPSNSPLPELSVPQRWDYLSSDSANVKALLHSRNLLIVTVFACIA